MPQAIVEPPCMVTIGSLSLKDNYDGDDDENGDNEDAGNLWLRRQFEDDMDDDNNRDRLASCKETKQILEEGLDDDKTNNSNGGSTITITSTNSMEQTQKKPTLNKDKLEELFLPQNDFFAETPYYNAFVEKEMYSLEVFLDIIKDINKKSCDFAVAGNQMAIATRNLSLSCKLRRNNKTKTLEEEYDVERRKKALGPEMATLLKNTADTLEEIAMAQESMCLSVKTALGLYLTETLENEIEIAKKKRMEAESVTLQAEQLFSSYLQQQKRKQNEKENKHNSGSRITKKEDENERKKQLMMMNEQEKKQKPLVDTAPSNDKDLDNSKINQTIAATSTEVSVNGENNSNAEISLSSSRQASATFESKEEELACSTHSKSSIATSNRKAEFLRSDSWGSVLIRKFLSPTDSIKDIDDNDNSSKESIKVGESFQEKKAHPGNYDGVSRESRQDVFQNDRQIPLYSDKESISPLVDDLDDDEQQQQQQTDCDHLIKTIKLSLTSGFSGIPEEDLLDPLVTKAILLANSKRKLEEMKLVQATAQLKRIQLSKHFVDAAHQGNVLLSQTTERVLNALNSYYNTCSDNIKQLIPKVKQNKYNITKTYSLHQNQKSFWQARQKSTFDTVIKIEKATTDADYWLESISGRGADLINSEVLSIQKIETDVKIWDLPTELALISRCNRETRPGVLMEGWLYRKNQSRMSLSFQQPLWRRHWFVLKDHALFCLESSSNTLATRTTNQALTEIQVCEIGLSTVRELKSDDGNQFCFELVQVASSSDNSKSSIIFQARGPNDFHLWTKAIRSAIEKMIFQGDIFESLRLNSDSPNNISRNSSHENNESVFDNSFFMEMTEFNHQYHQEQLEKNKMQVKTIGTEMEKSLQQLMDLNPTCADCGMESPDWVSLNLGVLICINCSGVHRSLGVHISKVRSLRLDSLSNQETRLLFSLGNDRMNSIWEKEINLDSSLERPTSFSGSGTREKWIIRKYVTKEFLANHDGTEDSRPAVEIDNKNKIEKANKSLYDAASRGDVLGVASSLAHGGSVCWKNEKDGNNTAMHTCLASLKQMDTDGDDAIGNNNPLECIELLLQNGAETKSLNLDDKTILESLYKRSDS